MMSRRTILLLGSLILEVLTDYQMIVTYGRPDQFTGSTTLGLAWTECVTRCHEQSDCLVVYDSDCLMFTVGQIGRVLKEPSGPEVAIKISATGSCPEDDEVSDSGFLADDSASPPTYRNWSMTYSDPYWSFVDSGPLSCPIGFSLLIRPKGPWCAMVVTVTGCIEQTDAVAACASSFGGVLSGLEDVDEFHQFGARCIEIFQSRPASDVTAYKSLAFWVDGYRKEACKRTSATTLVPASCSGTDEFSFLDPTLSSNPTGYIWSTGGSQPDGKKAYPTVANCVNIVVFNATTDGYGTDDFVCNNATTINVCYRGYICGRTPS